MRKVIIIGVLVLLALLMIAQFGPSLVRGETMREAGTEAAAGVNAPSAVRAVTSGW